jgi:hypothetical protein
MTKKQIVHNFGDGRGEILAHQHINPDGSIGGWVANSVEISAEAKVFIGKKVVFSGYWKTYIRGGDFWGGTFRGGDFWGGTFRGGDFRGGDFRGGTFRGGDFWGGTFRGGDFWGGTFRGGDFWGGDFWGGTFRGGDFRGGTFLGGTFRGGTFRGGEIKTNRDFSVFACFGSRNDFLTVQFEKDGPLFTTGCQTRITLKEFTDRVEKTHGKNTCGLEYRILIKTVKDLWKIRKAELFPETKK